MAAPRFEIPAFEAVKRFAAQRAQQTGLDPTLGKLHAKLHAKYATLKPEKYAARFGGGSYSGNFSPQELVRLMYEQGIRDPDRLATLLAIAKAESGWNPSARALDADDDSWGLFQINVRPEANPKYRSWNLTDPVQNVRAMMELSGGGQNLRPWTAYTSGKYRQYLPEAYDIVRSFFG